MSINNTKLKDSVRSRKFTCFSQVMHTELFAYKHLFKLTVDVQYKPTKCEYNTVHVHGAKSIKFNVHGSVYCTNILIYIQQDATLHSLLTWICLTRGYYISISVTCKVTNDVTRLRHKAAAMRAHNVLRGTAAAMCTHNVLLQGIVEQLR
jgi:hypothetical protein